MSIELSIVCGTRNRPKSFRRFFDSVMRSATVESEIVVGDASDRGQDGYTCDCHIDAPGPVKLITVMREHPRLGVVKGYNRLFGEVQGRYVAFFNDDAELIPGWDRIAIDYMDKFREIGMGCIYWRDPGGSYYLQSFQGMVYANFGVVRREVGEQVGWLDDREVFIPELSAKRALTFYGMDNSIAMKIIDAGYAVCGIPHCKCEHHRDQDEVRQENTRQHLMSSEKAMTPGSLPGRILWELWNGDIDQQRQFGHEYGYKRLKQKYAKYAYLEKPINHP